MEKITFDEIKAMDTNELDRVTRDMQQELHIRTEKLMNEVTLGTLVTHNYKTYANCFLILDIYDDFRDGMDLEYFTILHYSIRHHADTDEPDEYASFHVDTIEREFVDGWLNLTREGTEIHQTRLADNHHGNILPIAYKKYLDEAYRKIVNELIIVKENGDAE